MLDRCFDDLGDGVLRSVRTVQGSAWNDDASRVAFWLPRGDITDLRVRERVYCVDAREGRVTCVLEGPDVVRALAWLDRETLLVLREWQGHGDLTAHAVPDGGVVAEALLADTSGPAQIELSRDRRTALVSPRWAMGGAGKAYVLQVPEFSVLRSIRPLALRRTHATTYPNDPRLSPDGDRVVMPFLPDPYTRFSEVLWVRADRDDDDDNAGLWLRDEVWPWARWLRRGEVLLTNTRSERLVRVLAPPPGVEREMVEARRGAKKATSGLWCWAVHPDGDRLVSAPETTTPVAPKLTTFADAGDTEVSFVAKLPVTALAWRADGAAVLVLSGDETALTLCSLDVRTPPTRRWRGGAVAVGEGRVLDGWTMLDAGPAMIATAHRRDKSEWLYRVPGALLAGRA